MRQVPLDNEVQNSMLEIPYLLKNLTAVVAVIVDEQGYVLDSNRGFYSLVNQDAQPESNWNVREMFVQPNFTEFLSVYTKQPMQSVYQGVMNVGDPNVSCRSIVGAVYRYQDRILVIGEYDIADMERLSSSVLELNDELAQTQRELVRANRDLKRKEAKITEMMLTDPMTGIANRRHFDQRIEEEILRHKRYQHSLSIVMGDIDLFKSINDTYGHDVGDVVICSFAHTMRDNKRASDFVARVGGEEFIMVLPQTKTEEAFLVVDRIRKLFGEINHPGIERAITASFGVTELRPNDTVECLIKRSDQCLYQAKEGGRNLVVSHV